MVDSGVDRILVDLEIVGKVERQGHLNTVISHHTIEDVAAIRAAVPDAELMVRLNPVHKGTYAEVDAAIAAGADILMLPMFRTVAEVEKFAGLIDGRCRLCLLVETKEAMSLIDSCASVSGVHEVHIGLNDLSLDLGLDFMFSPFPLGLIDDMATRLAPLGKPFGIGGLARADEGLLPARLLLGEHVRLGSSATILSRTFHRQHQSVEAIRGEMDFAHEVQLLREAERAFQTASPEALEANRIEIGRLIAQIRSARSEPSR